MQSFIAKNIYNVLLQPKVQQPIKSIHLFCFILHFIIILCLIPTNWWHLFLWSLTKTKDFNVLTNMWYQICNTYIHCFVLWVISFNRLSLAIFVPVPSHDLDLQRHISWSLLCSIACYDLRVFFLLILVAFFTKHCLIFLFIN